jgi:hypothetical protein
MKTTNTNIDTNMLENILKEHLVKEVKDRLYELIDNDMESIARNAVIKFLNFRVEKNSNTPSLEERYYFDFVQNITKTIIKEKVLEEKK